MSEIKRCEICSTDEKDVMPALYYHYDYHGAHVRRGCPGCGIFTGWKMLEDLCNTDWNELMSKFSAKIESECAAARKKEREKAVDEMVEGCQAYTAAIQSHIDHDLDQEVHITEIRAVAEEVKAR